MSNITDYILSKTNRLKIEQEITPGRHDYMMFNDAGTEVEVSEFLYGFVRMIRPQYILETGTHIGVSSTYMGQALVDNNKGKLLTFEIIPQHFKNAGLLWRDVGVDHVIEPHKQSSLGFTPGKMMFEILFLDSEPQLRFDEFNKFWDNLAPGGFIIIHDLNAALGHHGQTYHDVYDWPWGDFRPKIGKYIKDHKVQVMSFDTPRGLTIFQKVKEDFAFLECV